MQTISNNDIMKFTYSESMKRLIWPPVTEGATRGVL